MAMISVEAALAHVLAGAGVLSAEDLPLAEAQGRWLAAPAVAGHDQPPFDASAMDGYWCAREEYRLGALRVVGEAAAGHPFGGVIGAGECIRIFTGAKVPRAGGVVVMQEHIRRSGDLAEIVELSGKDNIRPRGGDFAMGQAHFPRKPLSARDIGLLAAMNVARVSVVRRPRVAVISTGDELVELGGALGEGQIICSNALGVAGQAREAGAEVHILPIARDTEASLRAVFAQAEALAPDLIVTSGGASVGDHDLVAKVAGERGLERAFWKIAMRPGKPLMMGKLGRAVMLGLPGNPVAAMVCAELFLRPLLQVMQGGTGAHQPQRAVLGCDLPPEGERQHYQRARLEGGVITPFASQDSAMMAGLAAADALLIRPANDPARAQGEEVLYLPLA